MLDLLAHCHDFEVFSSGPRYAARLAGALGGSLTGLYVSPPLPAPGPGGAQTALAAEYLAYVHEGLERARLARHDFTRWTAQLGVAASHWQLALGDTSEALIAAGNCVDGIVIEHRARAPNSSLSIIGKTLLSGVPCIVVPENESNARPDWERVAIGWNGSAGAVRAMHAALPLLRMAREIYLFSAPLAAGRTHAGCEPEFSIERHLERHALKAKWVTIDTNHHTFDEAVLVESSRRAIDLLVMGAFGTTRFHEDHTRGTTYRVLQQSVLPVFVRH